MQSIHDDDEDELQTVRVAPSKALMLDCNGELNAVASQSQRSDHIPLLTNTNRNKRWHSLEMVRCVASTGDNNAIGGCDEDYKDDRNSKKSLGRNIIKSWLVGLFNPSSNGALRGSQTTSTRNGSGMLLPLSQSQVHPSQQLLPTSVSTITKPDKETSIV